MKADKETKARLLASAKKEFMEKGYMQASLRNICRNAGVTTGALYFFFQDKEDLFASLVEEPLQKLYEVMNHHYAEEQAQADSGCQTEDFSKDTEAAKQVIHYMYQYYDEIQLIITRAQGSRFEQCVDQFVEISEKHYRVLADKTSEQKQAARVDDYMIHWMAHMQIDLFVHLLTHEKSEKAALKHMEFIMKYLISGWQGMFEL